MEKENSPIISDEFLEELVESINQQFGWPDSEIEVGPLDKED
jgi:hypothetical protein